ncbi:MAG: hypothetical protein H7Y07_01645 [Pyrinomonadaceae bacterium]|nr:hypothetical protein [Sphingobacteriaceae bacterium]
MLLHLRNSSDKNSVTLDTRDIPTGTYYLHIHDNKELLKKQIIINH